MFDIPEISFLKWIFQESEEAYFIVFSWSLFFQVANIFSVRDSVGLDSCKQGAS